MRLLLTGAGGFIGRNMLPALPPTWEVVALQRQLPSQVSTQEHESRGATLHPHIQIIACDLTDPLQVQQVAATVGSHFDACLYLASNTSIPDSVAHPARDLANNTMGLINTLEAFAFDHLVYLSSGAVYVGLEGLVGPTSRVAPALPYAISKWAAEHYVQAFARHRGNPQRATIIRFFGAYGPFEPPRKLYTKLVQRFAFERDPAFMVTGDGENLIDAMYVDDAVQALLAVLANPPDDILTIDLGVANRETVNQVVRRAARTFGLTAQITHAGGTPEYITFHIDPQPFIDRFQVTPTVRLEDGLQRLAAHLRTEGASA